MHHHRFFQSFVGLLVCGLWLVATKSETVSILEVLEKFAKNPFQNSTGLVYENYETMYNAIKRNFSPEELEQRRKNSPSFRLLLDFIITPMDRFRLSPSDDEIVKSAYVKRIEQTYRRFWPSYVDKRPINSRLFYAAKNFMKFLDSLQKRIPEEPTQEAFEKAMKEYRALELKADEMVKHEDIYYHLDDYEYIRNFFNEPRVKFFTDYFTERFAGCETPEQMNEVIALYRSSYNIQ